MQNNARTSFVNTPTLDKPTKNSLKLSVYLEKHIYEEFMAECAKQRRKPWGQIAVILESWYREQRREKLNVFLNGIC